MPDAPVSLAENRNERTSTTLGLTWSDGLDSGGLSITKYRVTVSSLIGSFLVIADDISLQSYTAIGLTIGETYVFKV